MVEFILPQLGDRTDRFRVQGIISMQVQFFYAWRLHKLTGSKLLVGAVLISSTVGGRERDIFSVRSGIF